MAHNPTAFLFLFIIHSEISCFLFLKTFFSTLYHDFGVWQAQSWVLNIIKVQPWPLAIWSFSMSTSKLDRHFYGYLCNKMVTALYFTLTVWKALLVTDLVYCKVSLTAELWTRGFWCVEHHARDYNEAGTGYHPSLFLVLLLSSHWVIMYS